MFGSEILEVGIGLVFIFLIASLLATALREAIESALKTRAVQLERGLRQMLDDPTGTKLTKAFFDHSLIFGLFDGQYDPGKQLRGFRLPGRAARQAVTAPDGTETTIQPLRLTLGSNLPAYIPSRNFALAVLDLVGGQGGVVSIESLKASAMTLPEGRLRQAVLLALSEAGDDFDRVRTSLEAWFDGTMDRVSGWYKRETQWILMAIGLGIAVLFNIDSIAVVRDLSTNNALRQALIARVDSTYGTLRADPATPAVLRQHLAGLSEGVSDVIGWGRFDKRREASLQHARDRGRSEGAAELVLWLVTALGWVLTALAVSVGAPFWFDLLNKFMVIRSTVKPYEKSSPEGSEDRAGLPPSAERLAPRAATGFARLPAAAAAVTGGQAGQAAAAPLAPATATVRLAIDAADLDPGTLRVTCDGAPVPASSEGFVELPLEVGPSHALAAEARRDGKRVTWEDTVVAALDSEGEPMEAALA